MTKRGKRRAAARAKAEDHTVVAYPVIRDRFLGSADKTDEIEWLVAVGRFVQDRWLAEENECGGKFDEEVAWDVWDKCTEKQLRDLRSEAGAALKEYVDQKSLTALGAWWKAKADPVRGLLNGLKWTLEQSLRAVVGAVALIVVGLLVVWLAPGLVKRAHGTLDAVLHEEPSQPAQSGVQGAPL